MHAALLTAGFGGDDLANLVCITGIKNVDDYTEPLDHHEASVSPDAEHWSSAMEERFASLKRTELMSDPVP